MTRDEAIARLRPHVADLRHEGVRGLALFGSTARNEARPDSDIDLLVDIDLDAHPAFDLLALVGIGLRIEDDLGVPVHPIVLQGTSAEFRERVMRDAVVVQ